MTRLLLGPMLRYVGETEATVWVETDRPCEVEVLGARRRTFAVGGHHYALVHVRGLARASRTPYEVRLDGERCWPGEELAGFPPPVIRTLGGDDPLRVAFGSCRVALPHEPPHSLAKDEDPRGRGIDALHALALHMRDAPPGAWPQLLLWLGDQIYADEISPGVADFIAGRDPAERNGSPLDQVADFEEYTRLYWEAWSPPAIRWLVASVPSAMLFDDHDVHDDWNTSGAWIAAMRAKPWWEERIAGGFMSYWVYQHVGNLPPGELADDPMWRRAREGGDITADLRAFALRADRDVHSARWSFSRDIGRVRLIGMDSRAGRVVEDDRARQMVDDAEWAWIAERATGDFDHLLLATSLPLLLAPSIHYLEAWNEAVCAGAWGRPAARLGERIRQALDLEHWSAFGDSFARMTALLEEVASGRRGRPPATVVFLSGDVHHAYLFEVALRRAAGARSAVYQAVCSPYRNALDAGERRVVRFAFTRAALAVARLLALGAGVGDPPLRWRRAGPGPIFANQVATLTLAGRSAELRIDRPSAADGDRPRLRETFHRRLAPDRETP